MVWSPNEEETTSSPEVMKITLSWGPEKEIQSGYNVTLTFNTPVTTPQTISPLGILKKINKTH
jgi:hypothetical protein